MVRWLASVVFLALTVAAPAAEQGALRSFGDWIVGCDNTRACRAVGFAAEQAAPAPALAIARDGRGGALPQVLLLWPDGVPTGAIVLSAGGETLGTLDPARDLKENDGDGGGHRLASEPVARAVLARLRDAPAIEVRIQGSSDAPFEISLKGASAALLFVDDRQKRVGTATALVRPGGKPASSVPPPPKAVVLPPPPRVPGRKIAEEAPPAVRRLYLSEAAKVCDLEDEDARKATTDVARRLSATEVLYSLTCWRAAYNFGTAFYIFREGPDGGNARRAVFPDAVERGREEGDRSRNHVLSNADFDENQLEVSAFHKGRGIGDCGDAYSWRWIGGRFVPTGAGLMPACRGFTSEHWLQLYRVEGRKGQTIE